jgi:uncharacterized membrane protein YgdD (TMEM256/DUF423 family)
MRAILLGASLCALGVALGAFGAHAVADTLTATQKAWWDTATDYVWYHGIAFLALSAHRQQFEIEKVIGRLLFPGIIIFSGSLYLYAFTGFRPLGMITPIGGSLLLFGWIKVCWILKRTAPPHNDEGL